LIRVVDADRSKALHVLVGDAAQILEGPVHQPKDSVRV